MQPLDTKLSEEVAMDNGRSTKLGILNVILFIIIIVLAVLLMMQLMNDDGDTSVDTTDPNTSDVVTVSPDADRLSRIVDAPEDFYGTRTVIEGEIQDVYSHRVFTISDQSVGDEILVVTRNPLSNREVDEGEELFEDNADAQVIGEVRQFTVEAIEQEFGLDFPAELETAFSNRPIMVADFVQYSDQDALFDFNQGIEEDV